MSIASDPNASGPDTRVVSGETRYAKLRLFNALMGFFHLGQGGLVLLLSTSFALPVTSSFLEFDPASQRLQPVLKTMFDFRIGPAVAAFLFMSALAHFLIASPLLFGWYERHLRSGANYARWVEYSFSASLMIVIIAMLVGVYDLGALILIFGLNAMMILFGWMMELHNQSTTKPNWTAYWFGVIAGIGPWIVIALYLIAPGRSGGQPPAFVYGIFFSIFLFFNTFAINQALQYKKVGPWKDYLYGERWYIILSLIAKSALAWQVFAGTLRPV